MYHNKPSLSKYLQHEVHEEGELQVFRRNFPELIKCLGINKMIKTPGDKGRLMLNVSVGGSERFIPTIPY